MDHLKIYEEFNDDGKLHYNIPEKSFKLHGYELQKLYARNYKTYYKKIKGTDIRCWVKDKLIEINDYFHNTINVVNYCLASDSDMFRMSKVFDNYVYMKIFLNTKSGEIINQKELLKTMNMVEILESEYENSNDWQIIVFVKDTWDKVIEEIVFLTDGEIKKNPNYKKWKFNNSVDNYNI